MSATTAPVELMTETELASLLRMSTFELRRLATTGKLPVRVGGQYLILASEASRLRAIAKGLPADEAYSKEITHDAKVAFDAEKPIREAIAQATAKRIADAKAREDEAIERNKKRQAIIDRNNAAYAAQAAANGLRRF